MPLHGSASVRSTPTGADRDVGTAAGRSRVAGRSELAGGHLLSGALAAFAAFTCSTDLRGPLVTDDPKSTSRAWSNGIETHLITSHFAIPLMLEGTGGFESKWATASTTYRIARICPTTSSKRRHGSRRYARVAAVGIDARLLRCHGRDVAGGPTSPLLQQLRDPHLLGRRIAALAADPNRDRFAGQCLGSWDLMRVYGLVDTDGTRPDWGIINLEARQATLTTGMPEPLVMARPPDDH